MSKLPKSIVDDAASIEREAAPYRAMTLEKRVQLLAAACRAARFMRARPDASRVREHRDPLPQSSIAALARLRHRGPSHDE